MELENPAISLRFVIEVARDANSMQWLGLNGRADAIEQSNENTLIL